jgi:hypothetical protein
MLGELISESHGKRTARRVLSTSPGFKSGPADFIQKLSQPRYGDLCLAEAEPVVEASEFPDA